MNEWSLNMQIVKAVTLVCAGQKVGVLWVLFIQGIISPKDGPKNMLQTLL
jgi:hypothetical protein